MQVVVVGVVDVVVVVVVVVVFVVVLCCVVLCFFLFCVVFFCAACFFVCCAPKNSARKNFGVFKRGGLWECKGHICSKTHHMYNKKENSALEMTRRRMRMPRWQ